jgi:cullin-4
MGERRRDQSAVTRFLASLCCTIVQARLHEENERCLLYLDVSTRKPLIATAEKQLLDRHTSAILDKGYKMLMDGNRVADLQRIYVLFSRVSALEQLRHALSGYIKATGHSFVMDEEKDKDMVSWLLDLKARLDAVWEESFSKNESFANTIKDAFEHLINLRQVSNPTFSSEISSQKLQDGLLCR